MSVAPLESVLDVLGNALSRLAAHDGQALRMAEDFSAIERDARRQVVAAEHLLTMRWRLSAAEAVTCEAIVRIARESIGARALVDAPTTLYPYQWEGVGFLAARTTALLADDPGLGKSLQTLVAAEAVLPPRARVLILAPATLATNWEREIRKWYPRASVAVSRRGRAPLDGSARYTVVSYDTAKQPGPLRRRLNQEAWDLLVLDEAHRVKNIMSRRHQAVSLLEATRIWLLTGTPIRNRTADLFALLRLGRHSLGAHRGQYLARFGGTAPLDGAPVLAWETSDFVLRRAKRDVLDLPPKHRIEILIDVPQAFRTVRFADAGGLLRGRAMLAEAKAPATLDRLLDLVETGEKIVCFSNYLAPLDTIEDGLTRSRVGVVRIDGSVSQAERRRRVDQFMEDRGTQVFVAQLEAAGEGLNLQVARHVVFNDLALVPASHRQGEDRCHRIGTDAPVTCHYVVADVELDSYVADMLREKLAIIDAYHGALVPPEIGAGIAPQALLDALSKKKKQNAS